MLSTMAPTSLAMCGGAEASTELGQGQLFGGCLKLLERINDNANILSDHDKM
jgi:hypothetical protein